MAPVYEYGITCSNSTTVWQNWAVNDTATAATTNLTTLVWDAWNTTVTTAGTYTPPPLTEEQVEANRLAAEQRKREAEKRGKEIAEAAARARALLLGVLAEPQREELERDGFFHVETRDGSRRYRLSPTGQPRRVQGEDGRQWSYCIHPDYGYPADDVVLAQKLLLEADEEAFLRIANARPLMIA